MRCLNSFAGMTVLGLTLISSMAQSASPIVSQRAIHVVDALRLRGIEITEDSLIAALRNGDPVVRALAAHQLAHDDPADAIPPIEQALSIEKDPRAQIGISTALWSLGDPKGAEHLQAMCVDTSLPIEFLIESVQHLQMAHLSSADCSGTVLAAIAEPRWVDYRSDMLTLLPTMYHEVPQAQADQILAVLQNLLIDKAQQAGVHLRASNALGELGARSSVKAFLLAISQEEDAGMRSAFQKDLSLIESKP